jgi:hypothetical protein
LAVPIDGENAMSELKTKQAQTDILNRLRRAEGQIRGIQRMVEEGESCLKIGQQFSAVRSALDSTYLRMTVSRPATTNRAPRPCRPT